MESAPKGLLEITIRKFDFKKDIEDILAIEKNSFTTTWTKKDFDKLYKRRTCAGFVAIYNDKVVGYIILEIFRTFFQLLNFAVAPEFRHSKVGTRLLGYLANQLIPTNRTKIVAEIRESNLAAQLFFRECGYRATQVLSNYYNDTNEDAYQVEFRNNWTSEQIENDTKGCYANKAKHK